MLLLKMNTINIIDNISFIFNISLRMELASVKGRCEFDQFYLFNPLVSSVLNIGRLAKILILI